MRGIGILLLASILAAAGATDEPAVKTGKERMGAKWNDPQRVDDCNVPPDKRDPNVKRPDCEDKQGETERVYEK